MGHGLSIEQLSKDMPMSEEGHATESTKTVHSLSSSQLQLHDPPSLTNKAVAESSSSKLLPHRRAVRRPPVMSTAASTNAITTTNTKTNGSSSMESNSERKEEAATVPKKMKNKNEYVPPRNDKLGNENMDKPQMAKKVEERTHVFLYLHVSFFEGESIQEKKKKDKITLIYSAKSLAKIGNTKAKTDADILNGTKVSAMISSNSPPNVENGVMDHDTTKKVKTVKKKSAKNVDLDSLDKSGTGSNAMKSKLSVATKDTSAKSKKIKTATNSLKKKIIANTTMGESIHMIPRSKNLDNVGTTNQTKHTSSSKALTKLSASIKAKKTQEQLKSKLKPKLKSKLKSTVESVPTADSDAISPLSQAKAIAMEQSGLKNKHTIIKQTQKNTHKTDKKVNELNTKVRSNSAGDTNTKTELVQINHNYNHNHNHGTNYNSSNKSNNDDKRTQSYQSTYASVSSVSSASALSMQSSLNKLVSLICAWLFHSTIQIVTFCFVLFCFALQE
ncbi:hypothetical protein RFI_07275 [Reticulomyxa filosa]|uniref:Uncharacterized protein n=1 Tax=Reticulomyxa filosa TaxID=46433 RepID=X6NV13_RETFI|nr:hypothetical protein RFI_07275 [Reticulomyxa filosa]|eukprot:ETO29846.1 hypothetical protein RFI_07275 [Reticulomyxa filosa]